PLTSHRPAPTLRSQEWSDLHSWSVRMTRTRFWQALAVVAMLAPPAPVSAQGTTGSISGFVTDDTGGALPGATVTVRHIETDRKQAIVTDASGRYRAQQLAPGRYDVTVELSGFRTAR